MSVDPETAPAKFEHEGETFYFCCPNCLKKFKEKVGAPTQTANFTQIGRSKKTTTKEYIDPICGMTVTPETAAAKYEHGNGETIYFCAEGCKNKYVSHLKKAKFTNRKSKYRKRKRRNNSFARRYESRARRRIY